GQQARKISPKHRRFAMAACMGGALLLTSGAAWTIASAPTPNERFELGINALTDGHSPRAAERQFTRILNAEPDRLDARLLRVCASIQLKDWNAAFGELKEFRGIDMSPEKHALAGYILCQWNQQNEIAEFEYERALDAGLERADTLNNLAYCQIRVNKLNAAVETLAQAKKLAPDSPEILLNEACVELKLCRELKTMPRLDFAEAITNHKDLANDREALLVAATIYWHGARKDLALSEKAFECLAQAVPHGLTKEDLESLPASRTLKSAPKYQQIVQQASRNRRSKRSEVTVARLIPPPIENRDYLNHLIASVAKENLTIANLTHNMTSTGGAR
ncbi:MAG TPA: hypothetical protein VNQ76_01750, partial [Planctomicrobium sp.]|nr:hypothetical protein [Planctomicrobium sp.]